MKDDEIKKTVKEQYGRIAREGGSCCCQPVSCCGGSAPISMSRIIGYSDGEISAAPEGANLGLGCGNPVAIASLQPGEVVLDLGAGAGFDCFLAAEKVGKTGRVIGVDMTPDMIDKAGSNAVKGGYINVEFRSGEIENLPVEDSSVDVVISNCVVNLAPDKRRVFAEAFRVLKPGGRLMVSDIVLLKELPEHIRNSAEAYVACVAGAVMKDDYLTVIGQAGFTGVTVVEEKMYPVDGDMKDVAGSIMSISVSGVKAQL